MAHGAGAFDILAPRSPHYQGPFGRICPNLPPWQPGLSDAQLMEIADTLMIELPGAQPEQIAEDPALIAQLEARFSSEVPAGYTYFGQFVDHDVTFDPASSLMRQNDPNGFLNFRTPRLDLDSVYGRGPADQPYLYDPTDPAKLAIGRIAEATDLPDLPRFNGIALIGDARNDENAIVSQLQLVFLLAHNALVDRARAERPGLDDQAAFEQARRTLRWLYQHVVWTDFLARVLDAEIHACALRLEERCGAMRDWVLGLGNVYRWKNQPFMPVEFSAAAYRFGHSMVRNSYQTNLAVRGVGRFAPIFDNTGASDPDDLRGFRPMLPRNCVQWDWFLEMGAPSGFPQRARKIDTKLANALSFLHEGPPGDPRNVLAFRNLKRGLAFGLPSGTAVARKFCTEPLVLEPGEPDSLWYYILKESERDSDGARLGRVGSIIVAATFAGLLKGDPASWVNIDPCWQPGDDPLLAGQGYEQDDPAWTLASIIRLSGLRPNGIGFT